MALQGTSALPTYTTVLAPMPDAAELRRELLAIGDRRLDLRLAIEKLAIDTNNAISRARGEISMTEIAQLVGVDRTGLYRTYGT